MQRVTRRFTTRSRVADSIDSYSAKPKPLDPALLKLGLALALGVTMSVLDTTIVNVAIATLSKSFHAGLSTIQWVSTGYLLALALVLPISGWALDRYGAKRLFLWSIACFVLCSIGCGVAPNVDFLIFFRILQGAGGACIMPVAQSIIVRAAGPQRLGRMASLIGIPAMLAPICGPSLGGLIIDDLSWRWIFFVNVPIGVVAIAWCACLLPNDENRGATRLDVLGLVLLGPGLAATVYGLSLAGTTGSFLSSSVIIWVSLGAAFTVLFVGHAIRLGERAILPMRYLRDRVFGAASVTTFVIGAALFGAMILLPLYYQQVRGDSAALAGLLLAPQGIGSAVAMVVAGSLTDRIGPRRVVVIGMVVTLLGTYTFTQLTSSSSYSWLTVSLFVRGVGIGASMMPVMVAGYRNLPPESIGRATTTLIILQRLGGSVGTAFVAVVLSQHLSFHGTANATAFGAAFWVVMALTAIGLVSSLFLPAYPPSTSEIAPSADVVR